MPELPQNLVQFVRIAKTMDQAGFSKEYPDSVLLLKPFNPIDDSKVDTMSGGIDGLIQGASITVGEIRKRPGANAFAHMITLGRASNNDVVVPASDVSKFHAYFNVDPDGTVFLTDAGSTNGTSVQRKRLEPRIKAALTPGDLIEMGTVGGFFHSPATFFGFLQEVIADPAKAYLT